MVVLHGQPRDGRGTAFRVSAHVLPLGSGSRDAGAEVGLGDTAGLARSLHGERRRGRALSFVRALEPRRAGPRGCAGSAVPRLGRRTGRRRQRGRSSPCGCGRPGGGGDRSAATAGQAARPPGRAGAEPQELGAGERVLLLLPHPHARDRHDPLGAEQFRVEGSAWMDREWSTSSLGQGQVGWDWFALQLSDGSDLMLYQLRDADGTPDPSSSGSFDRARRSHPHPRAPATSRSKRSIDWQSPRSGARYPARWRVRVPSEDLDLTVDPAPRRPGAGRLLPLLGRRGRRRRHAPRPVR